MMQNVAIAETLLYCRGNLEPLGMDMRMRGRLSEWQMA